MTIEQFRQAVKAKNDADLAASPTSEACELAIHATLAEAIRHRSDPGVVSPAFDPTFLLTIIQLLAPIILEWINRRFPRPATPVTPTP